MRKLGRTTTTVVMAAKHCAMGAPTPWEPIRYAGTRGTRSESTDEWTTSYTIVHISLNTLMWGKLIQSE